MDEALSKLVLHRLLADKKRISAVSKWYRTMGKFT